MTGEPKRATKVADRIRVELMDMLLGGDIHDPACRNALVSNVVVTDDLGLARVYVRSTDLELSPARRRQLVAGLDRARGFVRRGLSARLGLRHTPEVEFFWDEGVDHAQRIEELLEEVARERSKRDGG